MRPLTVAVPLDVYQRLGELAKGSDRSLSGEARRALRLYLRDAEAAS
jgi:predicted transcriptional regulator